MGPAAPKTQTYDLRDASDRGLRRMVTLYPRQQRRQAERSGKVLPDTRISKITLGKAGRGQLEAMKEGIAADGREGVPRRTHWVRGHYMRSR